FFYFQAEDGIRDDLVTGVQTCALPIFLHELLHRGHCLGRLVAVVLVDEADLAAVDAALVIDHLEVRVERAVDRAIRTRWSVLRSPTADDDLGVGNTGDDGLGGRRRRRGRA